MADPWADRCFPLSHICSPSTYHTQRTTKQSPFCALQYSVEEILNSLSGTNDQLSSADLTVLDAVKGSRDALQPAQDVFNTVWLQFGCVVS